MFSSLTPELQAALVAAFASLLISLVGAIISTLNIWNTVRLSRATTRTLLILLNQHKSKFVPFYILQHHLGGLEPNELRKAALSVGALRICDINKVEYWVLTKRLSRNEINNIWKLEVIDVGWPEKTKFQGSGD